MLRFRQKALSLFLELTTLGLEADAISFNALISACEKCRRWEEALLFLDLAGDVADETTWNAAISACEKCAEWRWALELLMRHFAVGSPGVVSVNAAISACEKCGRWQHALLLLDFMTSISLDVNVISL